MSSSTGDIADSATDSDSIAAVDSLSISPISDLSGYSFRFPRSRDLLPSPALHFSLADNHSPSSISLFTRSTLISLFTRFGPLLGLSINPISKSAGFVLFSHSRDSARALNYYQNQTIVEELKSGLKLNFSFIKENNNNNNNNTNNTTNDNNNQNNSNEFNESEILLPMELKLYSNILSNEYYNELNEYLILNTTKLYRNENSIGKSLFHEDGKLGLPKAKSLNLNMNPNQESKQNNHGDKYVQSLFDGQFDSESNSSAAASPSPTASAFLPRHPLVNEFSSIGQIQNSNANVKLESKETLIKLLSAVTSEMNSFNSSPFNRLSLTSLSPGQGLKRVHENYFQYQRFTLLINIGGSFVLDFYYSNSSQIPDYSIILPSNCGLLIQIPNNSNSNSAFNLKEFSYGIVQRTRDSIGVGDRQVKWKRTRINLLTLRSIGEPKEELKLEEFLKANPTLAAGKSNATDAAISAVVEESEERKLQATPISSALLASPELENSHVRTLYNAIASHFSHTRHSPWPRVESFIHSIPDNSLVADIGCGNGKYLGLNKNLKMIGMDNSDKLLDICRAKGFNVIEGDILNIPFESNHFDFTICIAVLHHISTIERRLQSLRELIRISKSGGRILLTAWALEQDLTSRRKFPQSDVLVAWNVPRKFVDEKLLEGTQWENKSNKIDSDSADKNSESTDNAAAVASSVVSDSGSPVVGSGLNRDKLQFQRYCHVYSEGELNGLFNEIGGIKIIETYYDRGNWCLIVEKL